MVVVVVVVVVVVAVDSWLLELLDAVLKLPSLRHTAQSSREREREAAVLSVRCLSVSSGRLAAGSRRRRRRSAVQQSSGRDQQKQKLKLRQR